MWQFSLSGLFGFATLAASLLTLLVCVARVPPLIIEPFIFSAGSFLGLIVGYRRSGPTRLRLRSAVLFIFGVALIGMYTALAAMWWQESKPLPNIPFDGLSYQLHGIGLFVMAPAIALDFVLCVKGWMWSAYDYKSRKNGARGRTLRPSSQ